MSVFLCEVVWKNREYKLVSKQEIRRKEYENLWGIARESILCLKVSYSLIWVCWYLIVKLQQIGKNFVQSVLLGVKKEKGHVNFKQYNHEYWTTSQSIIWRWKLGNQDKNPTSVTRCSVFAWKQVYRSRVFNNSW